MSLRPAADCHLFILEDSGILFCEGQQELHALNTSATLLWVCLEEGKDERAIASEFAETFNIAPDEARPAIEKLLSEWRERGLLAGTETQRPPLTRPPAYDPGPLPPAPTQVSCHSQQRYRLLDTAFNVGYGGSRQEGQVKPILAHLKSDMPAPHEVNVVITSSEKGFLILGDGVPEDYCRSLDGLGAAVKAYLLRKALDNYDYLFQIHAGVVERGGQCLVLPAVAGSGKTSLTAGLIHAGWHYLSDETAPLGVNDLRVRPTPLALATKKGAWSLLRPYYSHIEDLTIHLREDGQLVRYLVPSPETLAIDPSAAYPVRWIIFPAYAANAPNELKPLSKVETMGRLLAECLSLPRHLDTQAVQRVVSWIRGIDGYLLTNSSLEEAIRLTNNLAS